jgi:hypothetical protein
MSSIIEDLPPGRYPQRQASPKMKIEFTDQKGAKYSFSIESPSKENVSKLLDFVESVSVKSNQETQNASSLPPPADTNFNKVFGLVSNKFRFGSFTSADVLEAYETHFQLRSTLSTISTYLSRLADRGVLTRSRNGAGWIYRLARRKEEQVEKSQSSSSDFTPPVEVPTPAALTR